jgi:hypothetical protein
MADDYSRRAAKGQALNLAVLTAVNQGRGNDNKFIIEQVYRFLILGEAIQKSSHDDIQKVIKGINPDLEKALTTLEGLLNE